MADSSSQPIDTEQSPEWNGVYWHELRDQRDAATSRAERAEAANKPLTALLRDAQAALERVGCQFFACDGPGAPFVDMATCYVCSMIAQVRAALDGTDNTGGTDG